MAEEKGIDLAPISSEVPEPEEQFVQTPPVLYTIIEVLSVRATSEPTKLDINVTYVDNASQQQYTVQFLYDPIDPYGLGPYMKTWLEEHEYEVLPYIPPPPPPPPPPYVLQVDYLWTNMTDDEADAFDAATATATPVRLRRAFAAATMLTEGTELFNWTKNVFKSVSSAERADELFAKPSA